MFSHDKGIRSTSGSHCSGVTVRTEHHLFILLISRMCSVYQRLEALLILLSSQGRTEVFSTGTNCGGYWEMATVRVVPVAPFFFLLIRRGLWVIASGPEGYQVKATWWQAGWWFAPEKEIVITVSGWVKYYTVPGEMEGMTVGGHFTVWEWNYGTLN